MLPGDSHGVVLPLPGSAEAITVVCGNGSSSTIGSGLGLELLFLPPGQVGLDPGLKASCGGGRGGATAAALTRAWAEAGAAAAVTRLGRAVAGAQGSSCTSDPDQEPEL